MESMTGYAFVEKSTDQFSFSIEIKSLNSKYLETYINLPRVLRNDETVFDQLLKKSFGRGKIELSIDIFDWNAARPVTIQTDLLKKYYNEVRRVTKELKITGGFGIESLLTLDGVIQKEKAGLSGRSRAEIMKALDRAIVNAGKMRRKEGEATGRDLSKSLATIIKNLDRIEALSRDVAKALYAKLKSSIESMVASRVDDVRLYAEVAILADRQDINEEIVRLRDHLKKFASVMKENGQVGKKLDFLAQEMFREVNTIASKAGSSEVSHLVVDIKNHIDKIREQCRNIV
jgi:uncharacterized protein (TIGR00255 family)